jgi:hypothetical protein
MSEGASESVFMLNIEAPEDSGERQAEPWERRESMQNSNAASAIASATEVRAILVFAPGGRGEEGEGGFSGLVMRRPLVLIMMSML